MVVLISCMDHKEGLPYACMYVLSLNGAAFKTFMGSLPVLPRQRAAIGTKYYQPLL